MAVQYRGLPQRLRSALLREEVVAAGSKVQYPEEKIRETLKGMGRKTSRVAFVFREPCRRHQSAVGLEERVFRRDLGALSGWEEVS